ncbi:hypothetical protein GGI12_005856 [Dipsacomyces acuminosporus]|nr:hypothetical protein GGI12_005856 [Dipsacomyces acuminosporus]
MPKPRILVITYSTYGHINALADSVKRGLEKSGKVSVEHYQFPETLSDEVLAKMHAPPKPDIPVITVDRLAEADGFLIGMPTRFGTAPAQVRAFFDATGGLWSKGALMGKPAGLFFSTASQHGGQESTAFSLMPNLAHHGIIYVPFGFGHNNLFDNSEVVGGSAWGAGTVAGGDGSRQPSQKELEIAEAQGEDFARAAVKLAAPLPKQPAEPAPQPAAAGATEPAAANATTNSSQSDFAASEETANTSTSYDIKVRESRLRRLSRRLKSLIF